MPKLNQSVDESVYLRNENGELELSERRTNKTLSWGDEPPFIKMYIRDILYLQDIPKQFEKVILALLKRCSYASDDYPNCVVLNSPIKKMICKELGWQTVQSLNNALNKLIKGNIISRVDTGIYQLNPYFFGRGEWQDISRIRMTITYDDIKGKTFSSVVEEKEKAEKQDKMINFPEQEEQLPGQMTLDDIVANEK